MVIKIMDIKKDENWCLSDYVRESFELDAFDNRYTEYPNQLLDKDQVEIIFRNEHFNLHECPEEKMYIIALRTHGELIGIFEVAHGGFNNSWLGFRETICKLLLVGASRCILVHNHPSGTPTPSPVDKSATRQFFCACSLMGIYLHDHVIIGSDSVYSMYEHDEYKIDDNLRNAIIYENTKFIDDREQYEEKNNDSKETNEDKDGE